MGDIIVKIGDKSWSIPAHDATELIEAISSIGHEVTGEEINQSACAGCKEPQCEK